jgi:hypothetical protein
MGPQGLRPRGPSSPWPAWRFSHSLGVGLASGFAPEASWLCLRRTTRPSTDEARGLHASGGLLDQHVDRVQPHHRPRVNVS